jgi:hypothetical protein
MRIDPTRYKWRLTMGWTHHWQRPIELPKVAFAAAVRDCRKVLPQTGIGLAGRDGTGMPILRDNAIVFNGADGARCEPFEIHQVEFDRHGRKVIWSFCKTEHLPYDLCVQVSLIILKHHLQDAITITSDGKDVDWSDAKRTCEQSAGYGQGFVLSKV